MVRIVSTLHVPATAHALCLEKILPLKSK